MKTTHKGATTPSTLPPPPERSSKITDSIAANRADGYRVFPSQLLEGDGVSLSDLSRSYLNFSCLSPSGSSDTFLSTSDAPTYPYAARLSANFASSGHEMSTPAGCGDPDLGYITWGASDNLPNFIALANSMLVYTSAALKFNIDTLCGVGMEPVYHYYKSTTPSQTATSTTSEAVIPYYAAGEMLRARIMELQQKIFELTKEHKATPPAPYLTDDVQSVDVSISSGMMLFHAPTSSPSVSCDQSQDNPDDAPDSTDAPHGSDNPEDLPIEDPDYFSRIADEMLQDTIRQYRAQINELKAALGVWQKTQKQLRAFEQRTNYSVLNQQLFTDLYEFGICFPEIELSFDGTKRDRQTGQQVARRDSEWQPRIVGLGRRELLTCRLEKHDDSGVSRHVYVSNHWLNPSDPTHTSPEDYQIAALPAIDPLHPCDDLKRNITRFRRAAQDAEDSRAAQDAQASPVSTPSCDQSPDFVNRPTRQILPIKYHTAGRPYYPQPSYWAIYNDIYQFASTIIRDRAIRKQNENMFGRIIYVHSEYLDKLTMQINSQKTDEEKEAIKRAEINKIKGFLSNKSNNGQTFATCTFTGSDGKDHDAFRVETIPYQAKSEAETGKTEIADISGIILFAMECHPDLIGATPGGSSSSGGTYQREMLQIHQAQLASMQNLLLSAYNLVRDYNGWDSHLGWKIKQKTLTTLDRSRSGTLEE